MELTFNSLQEKENIYLSSDKSCNISSVGKVNFLIMGTQKGGTSALAKFLSEHPQIGMASKKEVHFFDNDKLFSDPTVDYEVYHQYFADVIDAPQFKVIGEATPIYMYWENTPERIVQYNPKIKLIFILRNPIDRAYSHWMMNIRKGLESLSFTGAIRIESQRLKNLHEACRYFSYIERGYYSQQIKKIRELFPANQLLFLKNEDLKYKHDTTINRICDFLEIEKVKIPNNYTKSYKYPPISESDKQYLSTIYQEEIAQLESLLDWNCSAWKNSYVITRKTESNSEHKIDHGSNRNIARELSATHLKILSWNERRENNLELAIKFAQEVIDLEPEQAVHYYFLGDLFLEQENFVEAIDRYRKAIQLDSSFFMSHQNLGYTLSKQGRLKEAIVAYKKAIDLQPEEPILYFKLGKVQQQKGEIGEAKLSFQKVINLSPNYIAAYQSLGHIQSKSRNYPEAIASYQKAIALDPEQPFIVYKRLGDALRKLEETDRARPDGRRCAISAYHKALKLRPDSRAVRKKVETLTQNSYKVICVLGMHRSGTSCLAGSLQAGGLFAGTVIQYSPDNIKGYRENQEIIAINNDILASNNCNSINPPETITWTDEQRQKRDQLIAKFFTHSSVWMFKDPRTLLTLPFWQEGIPNLEFIGTFRHPLTVAMSLSQRSKNSPVPLKAGIKLWINYNRNLLNAYQQSAFPLICFDFTKENYLAKLKLIVQELNQKLPKDQLLDLKKALDFYQSQLINQYQRTSNFQIINQKNITKEDSLIAIAEELYQNLKDAAGLKQNSLEDSDYLVPLEETIESCQEVISLQPNNDNAYYLLGNIQRNEEKIEEAVISYQKAIELSSDNFYYYRNLGDLLDKEGRIEEALQVYNQVLEFQPDNAQIYLLLGNLYAKNNNLQLAISNYQKAIDYAPDYHPSYIGLGKLLAKQSQCEQAIELYQKSLTIKPNQPSIYLSLGDAYHQLENLELALLNYQKALELNPNNVSNYVRLAKTFREKGDLEAAIAQYQKALELKPNKPKYYNILGKIQSQLANYQAAIAYYQSSLELDPQQFKIYLSLGNAFSKINKRKKALLAYEEALKLEPNNQTIVRKLKKLRARKSVIENQAVLTR